MKNRNTDLVAMRSSFSMGSPVTSVDGSCPPSKIRRTSPRPVNSSHKVATGCSSLHCGVDFLTNTYGFSPNEFLPIVGRKYRVPEALDSRVSDVLCDDALGRCLFSGFLNSFETAQLSSISKRFRKIASHQVNRLDLSRCPHLKVEDLTMIVRRFPNLKDLNFDYCKQFGISHLQALLPISAKLESLSLKGCNLNDSHLCAFLETIASQNRGSTRLKLLDLSAIDEEGSLRIGNATLEAISLHCPQLQNLRLGWCKNVSDKGLATLATSKCCLLQVLDLSLTGITDDSIEHIHHALTSMSSLTHLDLTATQLTGSSFFSFLARQPRSSVLPLRELSFQFMQELSVESLKEFLDSKSFRRLQFLDLNFSEVSNPETTSHEIQAVVTRALERNRRFNGSEVGY